MGRSQIKGMRLDPCDTVGVPKETFIPIALRGMLDFL